MNLQISGAALQNNISGGPIVCQQNSNLLCYQPSANNILSIKRGENTPVLVTLIVGNLTNSIGLTSLVVWTGATGDTCINWTNPMILNVGSSGIANSSSLAYWSAGSSPCNTPAHLYCVSQ